MSKHIRPEGEFDLRCAQEARPNSHYCYYHQGVHAGRITPIYKEGFLRTGLSTVTDCETGDVLSRAED